MFSGKGTSTTKYPLVWEARKKKEKKKNKACEGIIQVPLRKRSVGNCCNFTGGYGRGAGGRLGLGLVGCNPPSLPHGLLRGKQKQCTLSGVGKWHPPLNKILGAQVADW